MLSPVAVLYFAVVIVALAGMWKTFSKAGAPGWGCLIPLFNVYLMCKMADKPGWLVVLLFVPIVNFVLILLLCFEIARRFGKPTGFGLGMVFLSFIFWPILGFGDATWQRAPIS